MAGTLVLRVELIRDGNALLYLDDNALRTITMLGPLPEGFDAVAGSRLEVNGSRLLIAGREWAEVAGYRTYRLVKPKAPKIIAAVKGPIP